MVDQSKVSPNKGTGQFDFMLLVRIALFLYGSLPVHLSGPGMSPRRALTSQGKLVAELILVNERGYDGIVMVTGCLRQQWPSRFAPIEPTSKLVGVQRSCGLVIYRWPSWFTAKGETLKRVLALVAFARIYPAPTLQRR